MVRSFDVSSGGSSGRGRSGGATWGRGGSGRQATSFAKPAKKSGGTIAKPIGRQASPAPQPRQQPQQQQSWGGPIDLGGGGPISSFSAPAPVVAAPSEDDYLSGDSGYQTQMSALQGALQRYLADSTFQRNNYSTDYGRSLRELGYDEGTKAWNWNDQLTAAGKGYQSQLDDFGSRGMLQSSGYANAFQDLQRLLGQQYDAMSSAKNTFMTDLDNQTANYKAENTASQQAARAEALARRAAQYGL
ncbi:hypothetical protein QEH45_gp35 [Microbacterium phage Shocker]|uniref:Uncharacterized protein n=1 Tax=Microbacterium phage Shocker TaxID=2805839 RepID=A0A890UQS6_9CAUD|nr:hypothetical protein QEH45_gp35 [Microbacterium phage Shocker]QRI45089.1 hypothetical protein SEA_SHOCKER_35 [Microbacterium phage Shocker]